MSTGERKGVIAAKFDKVGRYARFSFRHGSEWKGNVNSMTHTEVTI